MTRKTCKRRHYRTDINPITFAMEGAALVPQSLLDRLRLLELSHIEALATGKGTIADLKGLTECLNLCETMADLNIGPEAKPACAQAQAAILSIMRRYERWKKIEATQAEIQALRDVYAFHDLQRQSISRGEYERAIKLTDNRIRSKHPSCVEVR